MMMTDEQMKVRCLEIAMAAGRDLDAAKKFYEWITGGEDEPVSNEADKAEAA